LKGEDPGKGKKGDAEPEPEPEQTQAISQPFKREREISAHKYFPIEQAMQFIGFHFSALNLGAATPFPQPPFHGTFHPIHLISSC